VLRWFLSSLRTQLYTGIEFNKIRNGNGKNTTRGHSIRKPLNAFLGEVFLAEWKDDRAGAKTRLVSEQVSHHPPITAMHISDESAGVRADGYARVEMTFNGAVHVNQVGHAIYRVDRYNEEYLVPLPDVKVKGFLSGCLYPEITGTYHILGINGFAAEIKFWGESVLSRAKRNSFEAKIYRKGDSKKTAIYTVVGCWSEGGWTVKDAKTGQVIEKFDLDAPENQAIPITLLPVEEQDEWESRRAWAGVIEGLKTGNLSQVVEEKSKLEQAQRQMRAMEAVRGVTWEPLFFRSCSGEEHEVFRRMVKEWGLEREWKLEGERTKGVWRVNEEAVKELKRPFRKGVSPTGYHETS